MNVLAAFGCHSTSRVFAPPIPRRFSRMSDSTDTLSAIACGDAAVLEALTETSLNTLEQSGLDLKTYTMIRIAALVAVDAAPVSYAITVEAAMDVLEPEDVESVLVALAPVVGCARIAAASSNFLDAFFDEAEDDDEFVEVENDSGEHVSIQMVDQVPEFNMPEATDEAFADGERELETV
jgi:4-carboxymuconolactone decarboxylase